MKIKVTRGANKGILLPPYILFRNTFPFFSPSIPFPPPPPLRVPSPLPQLHPDQSCHWTQVPPTKCFRIYYLLSMVEFKYDFANTVLWKSAFMISHNLLIRFLQTRWIWRLVHQDFDDQYCVRFTLLSSDAWF